MRGGGKRDRVRGAVIALAGAALFAACGRTDTVDLATRLSEAQVWHETTRIDFGTPAARPHLLLGWGRDEEWEAGSMVWGLGTRSVLEFYVTRPRPFIMTLQCFPVPAPDEPPQAVRFAVNGTPIGTLALLDGLRVYRVPVPASVVREGVNRLELGYRHAKAASAVQRGEGDDPRTLAVAWSLLLFDGLADGAAPTATIDAAGNTLTLPSGSAVDFFVDAAPGTVLHFDAVRAADGGPARELEVAVERDGQLRRAYAVAAGPTPVPWQQSIDGNGPTQIHLRALGDSGDGGGVRIARPQMVVPRVAAPRCRASSRPPATAAAPVIVYLIDTLRADHLGAYGYARRTSPHLDAFAGDAVRFADAVAQASWTRPAVASVMTGLTPPHHGAMGGESILPSLPTLASLLAADGYDTAGFVTNSVVAAAYGFAHGFATYQLLAEQPIASTLGGQPSDVTQQSAAVMQDAALRWLDARRAGGPPFLYLHASDPHNPYLPPSPFREALAPDADLALGLPSVLWAVVSGSRVLSADEQRQMMALYDADIAFADEAFGRFVADLRARGLYDSALIVVVADHGEGFGEHGYYSHANSLYAELLHIPLLIKFPQQWRAGTVVGATAQQIDILPTVLDVLGIDAPPDLDGTSLLPALDCPDVPRPPAYSKVGEPSSFESLRVGRYKVIRAAAPEHDHSWLELYDVDADPQERRDLADEQPVRTGALLVHLTRFRGGAVAAPAPAITPDSALQERLRALGYLQ